MQEKNTRPPIIVLLGHVDHGKTTLLDAIRKTRVAQKEAGGITQSIGAWQAETKEGKVITFIDTPGHSAFSKMRSRGAKVADIAILVVAADDGVQPQTKEALAYIKEAGIPFMVAITKVDLPSASTETVLGQLEKEGVLFEKRGGDISWVEVSAKTGQGIDAILDLLSLMAEVKGIVSDIGAELEVVVIETSKENRGPLVNALVRNGTLRVGDLVYSDFGTTKIRGLIGQKGSVKEVFPGEPVQILGFEKLPLVGSVLSSRENAAGLLQANSVSKIKVDKDQIGIGVKAQNAGSLEALLNSIPKEIVVVDSGVGDIYESDVLKAKSSGSGKIFAFESKASPQVIKLAEAEGVEIKTFRIIYELLQALDDLIKKGKVEILGKAEIVASFPFDNKKIAGCKVLQGKLNRQDKLALMRDEKEIGKIRAISFKKQKQEVNEVAQGEEFGILFEPQLDFAKGDMIVSMTK